MRGRNWRVRRQETGTRTEGRRLKKASQLYQVLIKAAGEQVLWLMVYSSQRLVQDRIKNYFEKYLLLHRRRSPTRWSH